MAHILSSRTGKRSKVRDSMKMPLVASAQGIASPSAATRSTKRQENPSSKYELNICFEMFSSNKIIEDEQFVLQQIDEAWRIKDVDTMFRLIKVRNKCQVVKYILMSEKNVSSIRLLQHFCMSLCHLIIVLTVIHCFALGKRIF